MSMKDSELVSLKPNESEELINNSKLPSLHKTTSGKVIDTRTTNISINIFYNEFVSLMICLLVCLFVCSFVRSFVCLFVCLSLSRHSEHDIAYETHTFHTCFAYKLTIQALKSMISNLKPSQVVIYLNLRNLVETTKQM